VIELDPKYADLMLESWQNTNGGRAKLAAHGRSFSATSPATEMIEE
jgi:hypothetical protein